MSGTAQQTVKVKWVRNGKVWTYRLSDGSLAKGWKKIRGKYYYFNQSGVMQANKWIGRYHVNASGVWDKTR